MSLGGGLSSPGQHVVQRLHEPHLVLSRQGGLEHDLWAAQALRPHKQLVVLRHVELGLRGQGVGAG